MRDDRLEVSVTFDSAKGYIASAPEVLAPVVALSLGMAARAARATRRRGRRGVCQLSPAPDMPAALAWAAMAE
jgi:hypothetical protein